VQISIAFDLLYHVFIHAYLNCIGGVMVSVTATSAVNYQSNLNTRSKGGNFIFNVTCILPWDISCMKPHDHMATDHIALLDCLWYTSVGFRLKMN
jgi:hypothetical protein